MKRFRMDSFTPSLVGRNICYATPAILPDDFDITSLDTPAAFNQGFQTNDSFFGAGGPVVPDTSALNLPGQLPGIPGGGASNGAVYSSDPMGMSALHTSAAVNPTPTGGYMDDLAKIVAAASSSFSTFVKGSPSVAVPAARTPVSGGLAGALSLTTPTGQTNWTTIGIVAVVLVVGAVLVVKYA